MSSDKNSPELNFYLSLSAALFVVVLMVSAWIDNTIRVLHVFEAIPYLLARGFVSENQRQAIPWRLPVEPFGFGPLAS